MRSGRFKDAKLRWSGTKMKWSGGTPLNSRRDRTSLVRLRLKRRRLGIRSFRSSKRKRSSAVLRKSSRNIYETSYLLRSRKPLRELRSVRRLKSVSEFARSYRLQRISR
jgi:hypothetical protein